MKERPLSTSLPKSTGPVSNDADFAQAMRVVQLITTMMEGREYTMVPCDDLRAVARVLTAHQEQIVALEARASGDATPKSKHVHCAIAGCGDEDGPWVPMLNGDFMVCEKHYEQIIASQEQYAAPTPTRDAVRDAAMRLSWDDAQFLDDRVFWNLPADDSLRGPIRLMAERIRNLVRAYAGEPVTAPQKFRQETHHPQCASVLDPKRSCDCYHGAASRETAGPTDEAKAIRDRCIAHVQDVFGRPEFHQHWIISTRDLDRLVTLASRSGETGGDGAPDGADVQRRFDAIWKAAVEFAEKKSARDHIAETSTSQAQEDFHERELNSAAASLEASILDVLRSANGATPENTPTAAASSPVGDRDADVRALALQLIEATGGDPDAAKSAVAYAWPRALRHLRDKTFTPHVTGDGRGGPDE